MLTSASILDGPAQIMWPPRDPDRDRPIRPLPNPLDNPFTYGTSFNPALSPSNANIRSRTHAAQMADTSSADIQEPIDETQQINEDLYSSGEERDDSVGASSSPERYLSDMDDSDDNPYSRRTDHDRGVRVRRGSEGYEVAGATSWNWIDQLEESHGRDATIQAGQKVDTKM